MSHHSPEPFDHPERRDFMRKLMDTTSFRGAIGSHPHGKLTKSDEGSLQFAIGGKDGKVVIDFGSPVAWIGMTPQQAMDLAASIMKRARAAAAENGETVHITIGG